MTMTAPAELADLRRAVARIERPRIDAPRGDSGAAVFANAAIDAVLGGGFAFGGLHEVAPVTSWHLGAATGFALALAARLGAGGQALWISSDRVDVGALYGHGLPSFGFSLDRMLMLRIAHPRDALGAMEEALKCRALACIIAELPNDGLVADLTVTRRLALAARKGGGFGILLRHRPSTFTSTAQARWEVASAPGYPDRFGGLGRTAFSLSLTKNRRGSTGRWTVAWNHHDCSFSALSVAMAPPLADRPVRAPLARTG